MAEYHRAFGVYGIIYDEKKGLAVIKKNAGPYVNRFDLPGGSLEDGEPLHVALYREITEETGLTVVEEKQVGITSFRYPWGYLDFHLNQHIAVFHEITQFEGQISKTVDQFEGQDSNGALYVPLEKLTTDNSSPLVLKAKEYLENDKVFDSHDQTFNDWTILQEPSF